MWIYHACLQSRIVLGFCCRFDEPSDLFIWGGKYIEFCSIPVNWRKSTKTVGLISFTLLFKFGKAVINFVV
jgi:hypothetical protein